MLVQVVDVLDHPVFQSSRRTRRSPRSTGAAPSRTARRRRRAGRRARRTSRPAVNTARHSFTPPSRQASTWQNCIAAGLHELLEHDRGSGSARRWRRRCRAGRPRFGDGGVAEHVVGARRLLDPPAAGTRPAPSSTRSPADVPHLVGVHHQPAVRADLLADDRQPADVVGQVAADLHLEVREPLPRSPRGRAGGPCRRRSRASRPTSCTPGSPSARISASRSALPASHLPKASRRPRRASGRR